LKVFILSAFTVDRTQTDKEALVMSSLIRTRGVVLQVVSVLMLAALFSVAITSRAMAQDSTPTAGVLGTPEGEGGDPNPISTLESDQFPLATYILTGSATTNFKMKDYNIEPPTVGPVLSIEDAIVLEVDVTAKRAS
jgi:hypothetical protein